ncbi:MAG: CynX/NimT family MFS transporter [Solirubrobacteraceae bacterium]
MTEPSAPPPRPATPTTVLRSPLLTAGVILVAANLRPVATSIGPLVHEIRGGLHLSGADAGLLLSIPVLCFGLAAPAAPPLSRKIGIARTIALVLVLVIAGLVLRATGSVAALFLGTTLAAAGAACGNVLLPVIVRRSFADRVGRIAAFYTTALVASAALTAGLTVPIANALGESWRGGLIIWAAPALLALLFWAPQLRRERDRSAEAVNIPHARLRDVTRDPLAWQLTIFFAIQSWGFYSVVAWLPSIFESHGLSNTYSGFLLGLCGVMAIPGALLVPRLAARWGDQRQLAFWLSVITAAGLAGILLSPTSAPEVWTVVLGIGQGASFPLALTMIVLRGGTTRLTSSLSTHVQAIGYLFSAAGPLAIGALHDTTGSWTASLLVLIVLLAPQAATGVAAGRSRVVRDRPAGA